MYVSPKEDSYIPSIAIPVHYSVLAKAQSFEHHRKVYFWREVTQKENKKEKERRPRRDNLTCSLGASNSRAYVHWYRPLFKMAKPGIMSVMMVSALLLLHSAAAFTASIIHRPGHRPVVAVGGVRVDASTPRNTFSCLHSSLDNRLNNDEGMPDPIISGISKADVEVNAALSRRSVLSSITSVSASVSALALTTQQAEPCNAAAATKVKAKGAAEYDLEFYMRNLIQGNNDKEGNIQATAPPPSLPSRSLSSSQPQPQPQSNSNSNFVQSIINDDLNNDCIAIRTLSQVTHVPANDISQMIISFRTKAAKSFGIRAQWQQESVVDEYYFDLTAYSLYRTAAALMPNASDYKLREQWVKLLGQEIYHLCLVNMNANGSSTGTPSKLTETVPIVQQILQYFQSNNFIASYRLGDANEDIRTGSNIFDVYDDEDIDAGLSINCLISLFRPATLTSSLQIVGEGSRFMPEFIGTALAAMWREKGFKVEYETYFVDEEYRPNPKDYFPSEQLLQYTLKK